VRFEVLAAPPYELDAGMDDSPIMEAFARQLERAVIERPTEWLWVQKRWKYPKPADA
jgi:lauroyl/myristoyl acyltransferase